MMRAIAMIVLCAAPAFAGWGTWNKPWSTREIRSNLWCALEERVNAADVSAHITNTLAAPTFWVSKSWLDSWDAAMLNTLTNKYVDVTLLDGLTNNLTDPCYLTIAQAMTNIGYPQYAMMPTNGYWFPSYTNYLIRKLLVQQMSNTLVAASFIDGDGGDRVRFHSKTGDEDPCYTNVSGAEAWTRLASFATNEMSTYTSDFVAKSAVVNRYYMWDEWHWFASAESVRGRASVASANCGTNVAKTCALWLLAVEYPGTDELQGGIGPTYSRGFSAQGDGYTGSNAWASAVSQASNQSAAWTNSTTIGSTAIPTVRPSPDPADGEGVGTGYKLLGAWLMTWAFEYQ